MKDRKVKLALQCILNVLPIIAIIMQGIQSMTLTPLEEWIVIEPPFFLSLRRAIQPAHRLSLASIFTSLPVYILNLWLFHPRKLWVNSRSEAIKKLAIDILPMLLLVSDFVGTMVLIISKSEWLSFCKALLSGLFFEGLFMAAYMFLAVCYRRDGHKGWISIITNT